MNVGRPTGSGDFVPKPIHPKPGGRNTPSTDGAASSAGPQASSDARIGSALSAVTNAKLAIKSRLDCLHRVLLPPMLQFLPDQQQDEAINLARQLKPFDGTTQEPTYENVESIDDLTYAADIFIDTLHPVVQQALVGVRNALLEGDKSDGRVWKIVSSIDMQERKYLDKPETQENKKLQMRKQNMPEAEIRRSMGRANASAVISDVECLQRAMPWLPDNFAVNRPGFHGG
jgi:hypothetical protein